MEAVGLALAIVATLDLCLKYGDKLHEALKTYRNSELIARERALQVEAVWIRIRKQMTYVREHHKTFGEELAYLQVDIYDVLEMKLKAVERSFNELHDKRLQLRKWRLVRVKDSLDRAITDLVQWQQTFDPTWMMILSIASRTIGSASGKISTIDVPDVDQTITSGMRRALTNTNENIFFANDRLEDAKRSPIADCAAVVAQDPKDGRSYIVEMVTADRAADLDILRKNICSIVPNLRTMEPSRFGLLNCKGVIQKKNHGRTISFEMVFRMIEQSEGSPAPLSLRTHLHSTDEHSLTERLFVAQQIARAVCFVHTLDFVHKNIRPESILLFRTMEQKIGSPCLVGFNGFRAADGRTRLHQNARRDLDLYRHPTRQGERPEEVFIMQHDIYSLGVVLLEIGLWCSFVSRAEDGDPVISHRLSHGEASEDSLAIKAQLISIAGTELPPIMGDKYTAVVVECLTCLDPENETFSDLSEFEDSDGIVVGVKFVQKVLMELEAIVL